MSQVLAVDVGGTKTLVGLYDEGSHPPRLDDSHQVRTRDFHSLTAIVSAFLRGREGRVSAACIGVAGPVRHQQSQLTNVPWHVSAAELSDQFGFRKLLLLNDVAAAACALSALGDDQVEMLQAGVPEAQAGKALISPGTGLGEAVVHEIAGRLVPVASESGHADFAARTTREWELVRSLTQQRGRASLEQVLSGSGLCNLFHFCHDGQRCGTVTATTSNDLLPAEVTRSGLLGRCDRCVEAVQLFVAALGSEAGNLALRGFATGGLYLAGGIVPHLLPALRQAPFLDAFHSKPPMTALLQSIPVAVVAEPQAVLLGAAIAAQQLLAV